MRDLKLQIKTRKNGVIHIKGFVQENKDGHGPYKEHHFIFETENICLADEFLTMMQKIKGTEKPECSYWCEVKGGCKFDRNKGM